MRLEKWAPGDEGKGQQASRGNGKEKLSALFLCQFWNKVSHLAPPSSSHHHYYYYNYHHPPPPPVFHALSLNSASHLICVFT